MTVLKFAFIQQQKLSPTVSNTAIKLVRILHWRLSVMDADEIFFL